MRSLSVSDVQTQLSGTKKQPKEKVFGPDVPRTSRGHSCGRPKITPLLPQAWAASETHCQEGSIQSDMTFGWNFSGQLMQQELSDKYLS